MQTKFLWVAGVVALVLASLSGGYLYAAQGGASAEDKKQLGLFNGNDEFMGTVLDVNVAFSGGPTYYSIYISSIDGILSIGKEAYGEPFNSNFVGDILFESIDCTGNMYFDTDQSVAYVEPQVLFYRTGTGSLLRVSVDVRTVRQIRSRLTTASTCIAMDESRLTLPVTEVNLPFDLVSPLYIKPL